MAVRFDASSDRYVATINGGTQTVYSFCCWVKISVNRATWTTAINLNSGAANNSATFESNSNGNTWECLFDNGNDQGMVTATVGDWYFLAASINGTTVNTYVKPLGGSISNSSTATIAASGVTASQFWLGEWPDLGQWLNGCLAGVKLWLGAALTQTELDTEAGQLMPVRTANLKCAYPLETASTTDASGNGFTLTASGTPTTETGPAGIPLGTLGGGGGGGVEGAPTVRSRNSGAANTAATSHSINLPAGVVAGDLLLVGFSNDESTDPTTISTTSTGWTVLDSVEQGATTNHRGSVLWKRATGSDALSITTAFSQESTHISLCIEGAGDPVSVSANASSSTTATVSAHPTLTSGNYLSVIFCSTDSGATTTQVVTPPSGYTIDATHGSVNPSTTSSAATFAMERSYASVTSITPGNATLGTAEQSVTFHVAVRGVTGTAGPAPGRMLLSHT
jgi:Concanavalin A-like lectin/glucanases superfamily